MKTPARGLQRICNRVHAIYGHGSTILDIDWNCDGTQLASVGADCSLRIASTSVLTRTERLKSRPYEGHLKTVNIVRWSKNDPTILATASSEKLIRIWDTRIGRSVHPLQTTGECITMDWDPSGGYIVAGSNTDELSLIDKRTWRAIDLTDNMDTELEGLSMASFSHDGTRCYVSSESGNTSVLDRSSWRRMCTISGHTKVTAMAVDPNGETLLFGGDDALVSIWQVDRLVCSLVIDRLETPIKGLSLSHDGQHIAIASETIFLDIASLKTGEKEIGINVRGGQSCVAWHPKDLLLACARNDSHSKECPVLVYGCSDSVPAYTSYRER